MSSLRCSVIIPTFNCLPFLGPALSSVRAQAIDDIEIIVVDDGSSDEPMDWLSKEAAQDARLILRQTDRKGPSAARNHALTIARGRLVAMLDADDLWWPGKLARQLAYHENFPAVAFSFTDYLHVDMDSGIHGTCFDYWKPRYAKLSKAGAYARVPDAELELLSANVVGTSTVVASREALQNANGFATDWRSAEDWGLWLRLAQSGEVAFTSAVTMNYLMRPNSQTQQKERRIQAMRSVLRPYEQLADKRVQYACRRAKARIDVAQAEKARSLGARWAAAGAHMRAFAHWPEMRTARAAAADLVAACLGEDACRETFCRNSRRHAWKMFPGSARRSEAPQRIADSRRKSSTIYSLSCAKSPPTPSRTVSLHRQGSASPWS